MNKNEKPAPGPVLSREEYDKAIRSECVGRRNELLARDAALREKVERLTRERDNLRILLKDICDNWNEPCEPSCDSYGHDDKCKATDIGVAKRALHARVATLEAALREIAGELCEIARSVLEGKP